MIGGARYRAAIPRPQPLEFFIRVEAKSRLALSLALSRARRPPSGPVS